MKVLLVKPYNISDHIQPSLGLGYLANSIRNDCDVRIVDCIKRNFDIGKLLNVIEKEKPNIVGFQFYTYDFAFIKKALSEIKKLSNEIITVVGGPHPSACGEKILLELRNLDFAFKAEAEISFLQFISQIKKGNVNNFSSIPGLIYRKGKDIFSNPPVLIDNLDSLGFPAWDLIHPETYPEAQHGAFFRKFPIAPIITTRGCPFQCTFCTASLTTGKRLRVRSVNHVVEEIKLLQEKFGIREIHFVDDNFTLNKERAKEILRKIIENRIKISWAVPNGIRIGTIDGELLELMRKSGCYLISVGIESGSDRILKSMKKNVTVDMIRREVKFIRSFGFDIAGFFIIGFPSETEDDIKKTIELSLELDLVRANFFSFLPLPGSEIYNEFLSKGDIAKVDFDNFSFTSVPYTPEGFTRKKLKALQRSAFIKFHLRPKILFKNLLHIRSPRHARYLLRRVLHWLK